MIKVSVIDNGKPTINQREQFKQYASVPDDSRDAPLEGCLVSAMLAVQSATDAAMLPCTLKLFADNVAPGEQIKLYQGGVAVLSVTTEDGPTGEYEVTPGAIIMKKSAKMLTVTYTNEVVDADRARYQSAIWQYATALYDGEDTSVLNKILQQLYF